MDTGKKGFLSNDKPPPYTRIHHTQEIHILKGYKIPLPLGKLWKFHIPLSEPTTIDTYDLAFHANNGRRKNAPTRPGPTKQHGQS